MRIMQMTIYGVKFLIEFDPLTKKNKAVLLPWQDYNPNHKAYKFLEKHNILDFKL